MPAEVKLIALNPSVKNWPVLLGLGCLAALTGMMGMVLLIFQAQTALLILAVGLGLTAWPALRCANTEYYVTNLRVVRREGVFGKAERSVEVKGSVDIRVARTKLQETLGVGDLEVATAAGSLRLEGVEEPEKVRERILALA